MSKGYLPCAAKRKILESREPILDDQARVTNRLNLASGCALLSCLFLPRERSAELRQPGSPLHFCSKVSAWEEELLAVTRARGGEERG